MPALGLLTNLKGTAWTLLRPFKFSVMADKTIKSPICNIFTVVNQKMTTICYQTLRKHAKLKYYLPDNNAMQQNCQNSFPVSVQRL